LHCIFLPSEKVLKSIFENSIFAPFSSVALEFLPFYLWGVLQLRPTLGARRRLRPVRLPALTLPRQGTPGVYGVPPAGGEVAEVSAFHARVYHIPTLYASLY